MKVQVGRQPTDLLRFLRSRVVCRTALFFIMLSTKELYVIVLYFISEGKEMGDI